ncbi:MAG: TonB-dependent receptor [Alphaproteobacteria bacterium HGW-Alphaproteobacteria-18]|nr:MAG: TonB-dependent receptor [Alphaproteobacteria bacterium HGW-Alphaproteobacteria-18]
MRSFLHGILKPSISTLAMAAAISVLPVVAQAQEAPVAEDDAVMEAVVVEGRRISQTDLAIGTGQATNTVGVTREELLSAPGGISGLKMLETLPGFNVQTDGALGLYEFGNSVTVRAFNLQQIGFVLDGVPMGRSDAFGGSPIFRYVDNENLGSVIASPGAGDVSLPSYASLGPIVSYNSILPSEEMGGIASVTIGDDNLQRTFLKLETGRIGGFSAYISRSKTDSDLWRGAGSIDREHLEGKLRYDFQNDAFLQAGYVSNDFFDYDSPSMSRATYNLRGRDYGYLGAIPDSCISPRPNVYDFNGDGVINGSDFTPVFTQGSCMDYYEDRINIRDDTLYSLKGGVPIGETITLEATAYYEDKDGYGVSPDSYSNTLGIYNRQLAAGLDVVHPRGVQYGLSGVGGIRKGIVAGLTWEVANHTFEAGFWTEKDEYHRTQLRLNKTGGTADGDVIWDEVAYYRRDYDSQRDTKQYYLKDTIRLLDDKLALELGLKLLDIDYALDGYRDFKDYEEFQRPVSIRASYESDPLPMIGAVYSLNSTDQIFSSFSQNYALPRGTDDIFSTASEFATPKAEKSDNFEIGFRTNRPTFNGAVSAFYTSFQNRLVADVIRNPETFETETIYVNAGGTTAYGFELSGVWNPEFLNKQLFADVNLTYNHAELDDGFGHDLQGNIINPAGSRLADSPEWLFTGGITWEPTEWLVANISTKYTGERYADFAEGAYQDDNVMESYFLWSGYIDIGGPNNFGLPENVSLRFNIDNIFDEDTLAFTFTTTGRGAATYRPLNPRTAQITLTARF